MRLSKILQTLLAWITQIPSMARLINRAAVWLITSRARKHRPYGSSLWEPLAYRKKREVYEKKDKSLPQSNIHFSWHTVTDRSFFDLHLPPDLDFYKRKLPDIEEAVAFFGSNTSYNSRSNSAAGRSSVLFPFFAQWFTDGFFRSAPSDGRMTTSGHNIDLSQIYGPNEAAEANLRAYQDGLLKYQKGVDGDYLPHLGAYTKAKRWEFYDQFSDLAYVADPKIFETMYKGISSDQKPHLYATGLDRGNLTVGNLAMTTLFMREHNNIARELKIAKKSWGDEQLFHTARCITTIVLMKVVIEDYVNHIAGYEGLLKFDPRFAEKQNWYRAPWISAEFNLLYRWHGLIPQAFKMDRATQPLRLNPSLVTTNGISAIIAAASSQKGGVIGVGSTPNRLLHAEMAMIEKGREWQLQGFQAYRKEFGLSPLKRFTDLTDDVALATKLEELYENVDNLEFSVGLFAETPTAPSLVGALMSRMVAYDAITQIYTNPLLTRHNFTAEKLTDEGMKRIAATKSLQDVVNRNCTKGTLATFKHTVI